MTAVAEPKPAIHLPTPEENPSADIVIYDGHCKFCTGQVQNLARWDRSGKRLAFISLHDPDVARRFPDLSYDQLMKEMYLVDQTGRRHAGAAAFRYLTTRLPRLYPLAPIMWFGHTMFLVRLPFTRTVGWTGQVRDHHEVPLGLACRALWPHTLVGVALISALGVAYPAGIPYALFLAGGLALSIPLAVVTALPSVGAMLVRVGLGRLPEETAAPRALDALALPAIAAARPSPA